MAAGRKTNNKMHMHRFLVKHKSLIRPFMKQYLADNDRTFYNIHLIDTELCKMYKEEWKPITIHFRCWIISEVLLDEGLKMWSGKSHRVMYRPQASAQESVPA